MGEVNYCFIAAIILLSWGLVRGYRKGFLRIAVSLISIVFVLFIATKISPYVSDFVMERTSAYEKVRHKIIEIYAEKNSALDNTIPENQGITIDSYDLPDLIAGALISNNTDLMYEKLAASLFEEYISRYLAKIVIKAGSFIGLFIIFGIVMLIVMGTIRIIEKIPVLRFFNRLLGMIASLSISLIWIWLFYIVIMIFFTDSIGTWMLSQIQDSSLLIFLFNNNILLKMIMV